MGYEEKVWSMEARRIKLRSLLERQQETEAAEERWHGRGDQRQRRTKGLGEGHVG